MLALPYVGRGLDNLTELISEIVLASHRTVHCNARSNGRRGNGQDSQNHPLWTSVFIGEPMEMQVGIRHLHQGGIYFRWREQPFILLNSFYILKDPSTYDATGYDNHKPRPQETLPTQDSVDNLTKSCVVERLADAARIGCTHGVV